MPPPLPPVDLSPNFTLAELTFSQAAERRGWTNQPDMAALANLHRTAKLLEAVRTLLGGAPVIVTSGYRSPLVNKAVKGSRESAHMHGLAADLIAPKFGTPLAVCRAIAGHGSLLFDQLIFEGSWVHIGLAAQGVPPRRQVLTAVFVPGQRTAYTQGLSA